MSVKRSISCIFSLMCALVFTLGQVGPADAAPASRGEPAKAAESPALAAVCPPSIGFGETIQCSIISTDEVDTYTFSASAGDKVLVRMSTSSGTLSPKIEIWSGGPLPLCAATSGVTAEIATCTLPSSGSYSIRASDGFNGHLVGDYYLTLQRLNNPGSTVSLVFGQTLAGSISTAAEMDTYTFTASADDRVLVRMSTSSGTLSPKIRIYGPDGAKLCEATSGVSVEIATCTLNSAGSYSILAFDGFNGVQTGNYYIYLQRLNNPGSAVAIGFGQTLSGSVATAAEIDTYTFTASAGDNVLVRMSTSSGTLSPKIRIYGPDGGKLCEATSGVSVEIASCDMTSTGQYSILAFDGFNGVQTGNYYIYLQRLNNPGSAVAITFGQTLSGSVATAAEIDTYTFTASAGDKVLVRMSTSSGTLSPKIRISGPDGTKLCEATSGVSAEIANCDLTNAGNYSVLAFDGFNGVQTGNYFIYLQRLNNPGSAVPITFGQTLAGSIATAAEMDTYTFTASANDQVLVRMINTSGTLSPKIRVYGPGGAKLCDATGGTTAEIASCTLPSTGSYSILAFDGFNGVQTGSYTLYLQSLTNPVTSLAISGNAGAAGVTLSYTDGTAKTATADGLGVYSFTVPSGWTGMVTPSLAGYTFTPSSRSYTSITTDQTNQDYTANVIPVDGVIISGNAGAAGVTLSYTDGTARTATANGLGVYSFSVPSGWTGTVTPSLAGYTFTPSSRNYTSITTDQANQDYTASINLVEDVSISGNAGAAGATLSYLDGTAKTAIANGSGNYSFTVPSGWSGTVTPSLAGYSFTPVNRSYTNVTVSQAGQNYAASITTFADVPETHWAYAWIERLFNSGITNGCSNNPLLYCPEDSVTRAQMAIFLLRGIHSSTYLPPAVGSSTGFNDVSTSHWAAAWIKQLAAEGITTGCGSSNYCPENPVTRAEMALFLLRARHGDDYLPPAVGANTGFNDVSTGYWAAAWIKQLAAEGITTGCSANQYCPENPVTRAEMAVFLVRTFNLP